MKQKKTTKRKGKRERKR